MLEGSGKYSYGAPASFQLNGSGSLSGGDGYGGSN